jgi:hypothetical protein
MDQFPIYLLVTSRSLIQLPIAPQSIAQAQANLVYSNISGYPQFQLPGIELRISFRK